MLMSFRSLGSKRGKMQVAPETQVLLWRSCRTLASSIIALPILKRCGEWIRSSLLSSKWGGDKGSLFEVTGSALTTKDPSGIRSKTAKEN